MIIFREKLYIAAVTVYRSSISSIHIKVVFFIKLLEMRDSISFVHSEPNFIQAIKEGREDAIHQLHDYHASSLHRFATWLTKDSEESKDIVSEVFIKFLKKRETFNDMDQVKNFLYLNTRNLSLNFIRNRASRNSIITDISVSPDGLEPHIFNEILRIELSGYLHYYIGQLPERQRNVIIGLLLEGKSATEIGVELNIEPKEVSQAKYLALRFLRRKVIIQKALTWLFPLYCALGRLKS